MNILKNCFGGEEYAIRAPKKPCYDHADVIMDKRGSAKLGPKRRKTSHTMSQIPLEFQNRCTAEDERSEIHDLMKEHEEMSIGDHWYILPSVWWKQWTAYTGYECDESESIGGGDCVDDHNMAASRERPGAIDNRLLEDPENPGMLLDSLKEQRWMYKAVPNIVWLKLLRWYSLAGPEFKRDVVEIHGGTFQVKMVDYPFWVVWNAPRFVRKLSHTFLDGDQVLVIEERGRWLKVRDPAFGEGWILAKDRKKPTTNCWQRVGQRKCRLDLYPVVCTVYFCEPEGAAKGAPDRHSACTINLSSTEMLRREAMRFPCYRYRYNKEKLSSNLPSDLSPLFGQIVEFSMGSEEDNELNETKVSHHCRLYYLKEVNSDTGWVEITDEQLDLFTVGDLFDTQKTPVIFLVDVDLAFVDNKFRTDASPSGCKAIWARQKKNWQDFAEFDIIDVEDINSKWYEAQIVDTATRNGEIHKVKIHYINWSDNWDEWIDVDGQRISKRSTHSTGPYSC